MNRPILSLKLDPDRESALVKERNVAREKAEQLAAAAKRARDLKTDVATIRARWPDIFDAKKPKPLAIGAGREVRTALGLTCHRASRALRHLTTRNSYLWGLARKGSQRHNLDGTVAEPVSDEHRKGARDWLRKRGKLRSLEIEEHPRSQQNKG